MVKAVPKEENVSWLGRWEDGGWAIRIGRKLNDQEWAAYGKRADECWDADALNYSHEKALALLAELFPTVALDVVWPTCAYRTDVRDKDNRRTWVVCGNTAKHTITHLSDVYGNRVALARCDRHKGQL